MLAVENTMDIQQSDAPPIIEHLFATTEKLEKDKEKLAEENKNLKEITVERKTSQHLILIAIRLLCLSIAIVITILIYSLNIITKTQAIFIPFIIFFLLILPIERIKKLSVKIPKAETGIEIDDKHDK